MTELDMWAALVGFAMPGVVAVVAQSKWQPWQRGLTALGSCVAAAALTAYLNGALNGLTPLRTALVVAFTAMGTYKTWWKPSGIAPAIERVTNRRDHPTTRRRRASR